MKVTIQQRDLLDLVSKAQNIVEKRSTMPVLVNVLFEANAEGLKIYATNLEVSLVDQIAADVVTPGRAVAHARSLFDILKELPEGIVEITRQENNWLKVVHNKSEFNIVGVSPEEYPIFPETSSQEFIRIEAEILSDMIEKTIFSVSNDATRYHLNGVFFEWLPGPTGVNFRMVATDGHRLSVVDRVSKVARPLGLSEGVIIPRRGLAEVRKLLEHGTGDFELAIEGAQLILQRGAMRLMIRLIEGKYPNYQQLIPKNLSEHIRVKREDLLHSLRRVSLLSNQTSKGVTFNLSSGRMEITSNNPDLGDAKEEIEIDYRGAGLKIGFNAKYIIEVLSSISDHDVRLDLKDQISPGVMRPQDDEAYTCVIMPMRI